MTKTINPTIKLEVITPAKAKQLLECVPDWQRKLARRNVTQLAADMRNGDFKVTADTIKIDTAGNVIDGQHRLMAIVSADVTVRSFVARNVDPDAFVVLDQGKKRTLADQLTSKGIANAKTVAAALSRLEGFVHSGYWVSKGIQINHASTVSARIALLNDEYDITTWASQAEYLASKIKFSSGFICAFLYAASLSKAGDVEYFVDKLATGAELIEGDPILKLRNALLDRKAKTGGRKMGEAHYVNMFVRAWGYYCQGETISQLKGAVKHFHAAMYDPDGILAERWFRKDDETA